MKVKVIGCGNAFSTQNFNQSFVLEENNKRLLVDCGYQVPAALRNAGISFRDIDYIYISHLHADHIGGLEYMAFMRYDWQKKCKNAKDGAYAPILVGNEKLLTDLWEHSLRGGLESMEGFVASLNTFFIPKPIQPNETFDFEGWTVHLVQQIHVMSGSSIMNTFGLMLKKPNHKTIYFTTDSQHCSPRQIEVFYQESDMIIQDCELLPVAMMSGVHANYAQLAGYPEANSIKLDAKIKTKMLLSHYQDFFNAKKDFFGNECDWEVKAQNDGFAGFIRVGQEFEI